MWNSGWMKHKLESRLLGKISVTSDAQMTWPLWQKVKKNWFLECQCSLLPSTVWHFQFALIHRPNIPGSYATLLFTASNLASITSPIHIWVLFLPWLHPFILSGIISSLISSSILSTYRPEKFIFQCAFLLPFHTVHGVLKERILKWFAIPFSSGLHSVRLFQNDWSNLNGPTWHVLVSFS